MEEKNLQEIQRRLWSVEQDILDEIHRVCMGNGLRYSLAYGTLLGAVRHKGFIPWDDDIDVMMPREDYDRFIEAWDPQAHPDYILQTEDCSPDYNNNFAKLRKDHTTFLQYEAQAKRQFHKGIYVDIFPVDRKAPGVFAEKLQYALFAVSLLFNRGYPSGRKGMFGAGEKILLGLIPKSLYQRISIKVGKLSRRWNDRKDLNLVAPNTIEFCRKYYPPDTFEHLSMIEFNKKQYCAVSDYENILRTDYGEYMQLPPEEERVWKHHPVLIDFDRNIEEIE